MASFSTLKICKSLLLVVLMKVWHFRRLMLETLNAHLDEELAFLQFIATSSFKNYQLCFIHSFANMHVVTMSNVKKKRKVEIERIKKGSHHQP
ncbi:protein farnesyltransferase/geranylgeranyltransferase type-1 subunit alpha [Gossypium australe]|uniref:Protein farnesyltransferase/geranylgeranyltransferase type-1 subunit alpha n=1 Tax=Gossypium australe TaxID=47621 RepID=A0A5B6WGD0_9ROSI|nr:protein farnesyltransferase/geranylgeranyltransferase type-1 subunit alpha [Gossypium australe]